MTVAKKAQIKYYPVGNGDMSLITLDDQTTLLVDCNITVASINSKDKEIYDVRKDLLDSLQRRNQIPFLDVFILTHGDKDHCWGFKDNFYQGDPKNYSKTDLENNLILIDTMWFSPMIAEQHTNDNEEAYQKEAERRLKLHRNNYPDKDLAGNRVRIIGYDGSAKYDDLDHLRSKPGDVVTNFNEKKQNEFSIFIHAPFKITLDSPEKDKNSASIVFQARFKKMFASNFSCLAMFGGDSDYSTWEHILERTKKYGNDSTQSALSWDLFLAPHHCSWTFFNETPQGENPEPLKTSLEVLDYANVGAFVIASSKKVKNNDDNPPHYEAKQEYVKKIESKDKFLNTAVEPSESSPEPIIFDITTNGPSRPPKGNVSGSLTSSGGNGAAGTIITQG